MKKYSKHRIAAAMLAAMLCLTGCGSGSGGTTSVQGKDTESTEGTVTPNKPAYGAGITNLSEKVSRTDIPEKDMDQAHEDALSRSGMILLQKIIEQKGDKNKNYMISPVSIQMALGMTVTGADKGSDTEKAIMGVLMPGSDADAGVLGEEMATLAQRMIKDGQVSWNMANSVWVNSEGGVMLRDSYVSDVTNYYKAELFAAPFDQATVEEINKWVKTNTKEMIPEIIKKLPDGAKLALINAMAFEGEWEESYGEYDITEDAEFTNADGSRSKVTLLGSQEAAAIHLGEGLGFIRPYKGGNYSFVGILPPEGMSTEDYLAGLVRDGESFAAACRNPDTSRDVYVSIPEFETEDDICLDDTLKALGMERAYADSLNGSPEFRAMVTDDSPEIGIGTVIHKTKIEVDRNGTKAAAATAVIMVETTALEIDPEPPYSIVLDRPFVYAIVDNTTGIPVFLGTMNTIK